MSNQENRNVQTELQDLVNDLQKREDIRQTGHALQELGRRFVYRMDLEKAFADLKETDRDRVRNALSSLPQS